MRYYSASCDGLFRTWGAMAAVLAFAIPLPAHSNTVPERDWFIHTYVAQFNHRDFLQIIRLEADYDKSWLVTVGVGRKFAEPFPRIQLEWELQAVKHWGMQAHPEVNALVTARWYGFSWDPVLRNTVALGMGASHTFDIPAVEQAQGKGAYTQAYLLFELTAAPPQPSDWSVFLRIHHRSGIFGLVSDADGSNFVGIGWRHHF